MMRHIVSHRASGVPSSNLLFIDQASMADLYDGVAA